MMAYCAWLQRRRADEAIAAAFRQAFEESGLPPHPGGECPAPGCPCESMTDAMEARAIELAAAKLGIPVERLR